MEAESVPHPDSVELPVLALPVVEPVAEGVLDGALDAAGVEDVVLLDAGEDAPEPDAVVPEDVAEFAFEELDEDDGDE